mmetsp:Transcript_17727/g.53333  ORF Transcript_17727/g.53333 Transcript_17727/m.53333 type:complete len:396 (+) Transcript_17727:445-1632(+)
MPHKRGRRRRHHPISKEQDLKERDEETLRLVSAVLAEQPVDTAALRKLAAVRGLVNHPLRQRVWPLLLGLQPVEDDDSSSYEEQSCQGHRDSQVVKVDVERSLWAFTDGWSDEARGEKRRELARVLTATVANSGGRACYYQGLHDVASVLLMVGGEQLAYRLLCHLTTCQLRDCTRPTMDAVMEQLPLVIHILRQADPELADHITTAGILPYFALSWYITWFAHDVSALPQVARLFDLFMASHPLMPLYVGAVAMKAARDQLLAVGGDDPSEVHSALSKLSILGRLTTEELAQQAVRLFKRAPAAKLLRHRDFELHWSVAPAAKLEEGHWQVPENPPPPLKGVRGVLRHAQVWRMRLRDRKRGWLAAAIVSGTALVAALLAQPATIQLLTSTASS